MYESKKLMWEVDIVGDENDNVEEVVKAFLNRNTILASLYLYMSHSIL